MLTILPLHFTYNKFSINNKHFSPLGTKSKSKNSQQFIIKQEKVEDLSKWAVTQRGEYNGVESLWSEWRARSRPHYDR